MSKSKHSRKKGVPLSLFTLTCPECGSTRQDPGPEYYVRCYKCDSPLVWSALRENGKHQKPRHNKRRKNAPVLKGNDSYLQYLDGKHWKAKRKEKLKSVHYRCEICKTERATQVHHLHYRSLGKEQLADLKGICRTCHESIHGIHVSGHQYQGTQQTEF